MADAPRVPITFRPRAQPLAPVAAVARGSAARALAARLLDRDDAALAKLAGVSASGLILVTGDADLLPWVSGVLYLGRDPSAPALLLPTALAPDVPAPLLERAIRARTDLAPPIAVLADPPALVSVSGARPIERARLQSFLDEAAS